MNGMNRSRRGSTGRASAAAATRPRWMRGTLCLVLPLLTIVSLSGCSKDQRLSGSCGVVVDGSKSGDDSPTGFEAGKAINDNLVGFLAHAGCRQVVFGPIGGSSENSPCRELPVDIDPDAQGNVDRTALQNRRRSDAVKRAQDMLHCIRTRDRGGSDVFGGLKKIVSLRPTTDDKYTVLVISDFGNYPVDSLDPVHGMKIRTPAERTTAINDLARRGRIAGLSGVDVFSVGFGALLPGRADNFPNFDAFWHQLLEDKAKAAHFYERPW
jgi:hypothetical protein